MLGRLERELPVGDYLYEPKWDGFRCLAFRDGDDVELQSRHGNPLSRYFPELVEGLRALPERRPGGGGPGGGGGGGGSPRGGGPRRSSPPRQPPIRTGPSCGSTASRAC